MSKRKPQRLTDLACCRVLFCGNSAEVCVEQSVQQLLQKKNLHLETDYSDTAKHNSPFRGDSWKIMRKCINM